MSDNGEQGFDQLFLQRPESMGKLLNEISPEIYASLKLAIEIGKWKDGKKLESRQLEFCMQAVILYEAKNLPQNARTGFDLTADCKSKQTLEQSQSIQVLDHSDGTTQSRE